jgi:hypothetical protein
MTTVNPILKKRKFVEASIFFRAQGREICSIKHAGVIELNWFHSWVSLMLSQDPTRVRFVFVVPPGLVLDNTRRKREWESMLLWKLPPRTSTDVAHRYVSRKTVTEAIYAVSENFNMRGRTEVYCCKDLVTILPLACIHSFIGVVSVNAVPSHYRFLFSWNPAILLIFSDLDLIKAKVENLI